MTETDPTVEQIVLRYNLRGAEADAFRLAAQAFYDGGCAALQNDMSTATRKIEEASTHLEQAGPAGRRAYTDYMSQFEAAEVSVN